MFEIWRAGWLAGYTVLILQWFSIKTPFAAFSRPVEDVNYVGDRSRTKKNGARADVFDVRVLMLSLSTGSPI